MEALAGILAGVITIIIALLKRQEARKNDTYIQAQKLRDAVVNGDIQPIVDRLLAEQSNNTAGVESNESIEKRINNIVQWRMVFVRLGNDKVVG